MDGDDRAKAAEEVLRRYNEEWLPDFCQVLTDVNQVGTFGNRPLHVACFRGCLLDVVALINAGANVNANGDMGFTPLHDAVQGGNADVIRLLLDRGAQVSVEDEFGDTPIDIAERDGRPDLVALLRAS